MREERPYAAFVGLREVHYSAARPGGRTQSTGPGRSGASIANRAACNGGPVRRLGDHAIYRSGESASGRSPATDQVRFAASPSQMVVVADGSGLSLDGLTASDAFRRSPTACCRRSATWPIWPGGSSIPRRLGHWFYSRDQRRRERDRPGLRQQQRQRRAVTWAWRVLNDQLVFFASQHVEFWSPSTDTDRAVHADRGPRLSSAGCAAARHDRVRRQRPVLGGRQLAWSIARGPARPGHLDHRSRTRCGSAPDGARDAPWWGRSRATSSMS